MNTESSQNILVVTPLVGFGDGIHMIPFFQALHESFPNKSITWIVGFARDFTCHLKTLCPFVNNIVHLQFKSPRLSMLWNFDLSKYIATNIEYEYIFDFHYKWPITLLLKKSLKHKHFISTSTNFLFSDKKPEFTFQRSKSYRKRVNSVWLALNMLSQVTGSFYTINYKIPVSEESRQKACELLPKNNSYIGFVPCANIDEKLWPIKKYLLVAQHFFQQGYIPVFFLGPREMSLAPTIKSFLPEAIIPPLMDETTVDHPYGANFYLGLAERLECILTNDCGPGHLLNCATPPMVFLFGPTPPNRYAPQRSGVKVLCAKQWGNTNIDNIPTTEVVKAIEQKLNT